MELDLAQLANLGEFIGGAAVLVTLIYLAVEAKRGRHAVEAASVDALSSGWNAINTVVIGDRELSEIFLRGSTDPQSLDPVETLRYVGLINSYINHFQTIKRRYDTGLMPDKEWENNAEGFANAMDSPGAEWALDQIAVTEDVRVALKEFRTGDGQYFVMTGRNG